MKTSNKTNGWKKIIIFLSFEDNNRPLLLYRTKNNTNNTYIYINNILCGTLLDSNFCSNYGCIYSEVIVGHALLQ